MASEGIFYDQLYPIFKNICSYPHPSGGEKPLVEYIVLEIEKTGLEYNVDKLGNIAAYKKATAGLEHKPALIFQGHTDMVCVPDINIFPIEPVEKDGWISARGTTLGADNGIALAFMLQIMKTDFAKNPPMEFLFTVQEETGLIGASHIDKNVISLSGKSLINIDSEEIDMITVGCAGAKDLEIEIPVETENCSALGIKIDISGPGGHSGIQIHENIPNPIKILGKIIEILVKEKNAKISQISGGMARNAIPAIASAVICADTLTGEDVKNASDTIAEFYRDLQPYEVKTGNAGTCSSAFTDCSTKAVCGLISEFTHGVIKMNDETGGVYSSINLGIVEIKDNKFRVISSCRSCDEQEIDRVFSVLRKITAEFTGLNFIVGAGYPGWRPDLDSELLKNTKDIMNSVVGKEPGLLDIHAGLECGILMSEFESIKEAVSIGPNIEKVHSDQERLHIKTTEQIWDVIVSLIDKYSA